MAKYTQTYTVILTPAREGWSGYCLELPDCVAKGKGKRSTYQAVKRKIRSHLRNQIAAGESIRPRKTVVKYPRFDLREIGTEVHDIR